MPDEKAGGVYIEIGYRDAGLDRGMVNAKAKTKALEGEFEKTETKSINLGKTLGKLVVGAGGIALLIKGFQKLISFTKESSAASADAQETQSKFDAVFKQNAKEVESWADAYADSIGRNATAQIAFLASVQDTLVPLGFARSEAAEFSKTIVTLSNDLSSFNNLPTAEVVAGVTSALVGNVENLRRYGVVANEAAIKTEAVRSGLIEEGEALSAEAKARAIMNILIASTTDAQGDLVRTQDSAANVQKSLSDQIIRTKENYGDFINQALTPLRAKFTEFLSTLNEAIEAQKNLDAAISGEATADYTKAVSDQESQLSEWNAELVTVKKNYDSITDSSFAGAASVRAQQRDAIQDLEIKIDAGEIVLDQIKETKSGYDELADSEKDEADEAERKLKINKEAIEYLEKQSEALEDYQDVLEDFRRDDLSEEEKLTEDKLAILKRIDDERAELLEKSIQKELTEETKEKLGARYLALGQLRFGIEEQYREEIQVAKDAAKKKSDAETDIADAKVIADAKAKRDAEIAVIADKRDKFLAELEIEKKGYEEKGAAQVDVDAYVVRKTKEFDDEATADAKRITDIEEAEVERTTAKVIADAKALSDAKIYIMEEGKNKFLEGLAVELEALKEKGITELELEKYKEDQITIFDAKVAADDKRKEDSETAEAERVAADKLRTEKTLQDARNSLIEDAGEKFAAELEQEIIDLRAKGITEVELEKFKEDQIAAYTEKIREDEEKNQKEANQAIFDQTFDLLDKIFTISSEFSALTTQKRIDALDKQLQAELELKGLAEETEIQRIQRELEAAIDAGDLETQAELEKSLERAEIEKEFQNKKNQLEYEGAVASWRIQLGMALLAIPQMAQQAYKAVVGTPIVGPVLAPAAAVIAGGFGVAQAVLVSDNKPTAPTALARGGEIAPVSGGVPAVLAENGYRELAFNQSTSGFPFRDEFAQEVAKAVGQQMKGLRAVVDAPLSINLNGTEVNGYLRTETENGRLLFSSRAIIQE